MNTTLNITFIILLICFFVIEGLVSLVLLWKLCKKTEAIRIRSAVQGGKKNRRWIKKIENVKSCLKLMRTLGKAENLQKACENLENLMNEKAELEKTILDSSQSEDGKISQKGNQDDSKVYFKKLDKLISNSQNYKTLLGNPMSKIDDQDFSGSTLCLLMSDLESLKSYNSSNKTDTSIGFKSEIAKDLLRPILSDAQKFVRIKPYEQYFINITKAVERSFNEFPTRKEEDNMSTLLMYLAQLYSIAITFREIYDKDKTLRDFNEAKINSHKANVRPFCEKVATQMDIRKIEDKGMEFQVKDQEIDKKKIDFLKKYKDLDFNLLGYNYSKRLKK